MGKAEVDGGGTETVQDKVFLLSGTEVGLSTDYTEGALLALFSDNASRIATISADAAANSDYSVTAGTAWYWWLRTPYAADAYDVRSVYSDGALRNRSAYNGRYGLRPACNLSSSLLVSDSTDGDGCYTVIFSQPPTEVPSITVPQGSVMEGAGINVSWQAAIDPNGDALTYKLERKTDAGSWTEVYSGADLSYSDTALNTWTIVQYRVKAVDSHGLESGYTTSNFVNIQHNAPPVISGADHDLGTFGNTFGATTYTVTQEDDDAVTVTERLDGALLRTYNVSLGAVNTLDLTAEVWRKVLNGSHTLTITAYDGAATTTRTLTFTKAVSALRVSLAEPMPADARPTAIVVTIQGSFPIGSTLTVEACNNGFDDAPTWENITAVALSGGKMFFTNNVKTAEQWGVNVRATLQRGAAQGPCYISSLGGNFG